MSNLKPPVEVTQGGTGATTAPLARINLGMPKALLQIVHVDNANLVTAADNIPVDDTIPQQTEGTEIITATITPIYSTSLLEIAFFGFFGFPNTACTIAMFLDAGADAIEASAFDIGAGDASLTGIVVKYMITGTTSPMTFKIRAGPSSGAKPMVFNGTNPNSPTRLYGGVSDFHLTLKEYAQ